MNNEYEQRRKLEYTAQGLIYSTFECRCSQLSRDPPISFVLTDPEIYTTGLVNINQAMENV
jgi:hypothetical protein